MSMTPDQLTQAHYRGLGYHVIKVESWGIYPQLHRQDFLGIYDYLVFNDAGEMIAIQTTTKGNVSARRKKMLNNISFGWWTRGGRRSLINGWYKKSGRWQLHEEELTLNQWEQFQHEKRERERTLDTESTLFKELFPNGLPSNAFPSGLRGI